MIPSNAPSRLKRGLAPIFHQCASFRTQVIEFDGDIGALRKMRARAHMSEWAMQNIDPSAHGQFAGVAERELTCLHEGNFARFRIKPSQFVAWQENWTTNMNLREAKSETGATSRA